MTKNDKFQDSKFIEALAVAVACGQTIQAAADGSGCSVHHAYKLRASDTFKQRVAEIRTEATSQAVGRLSAAASKAIDVLERLMLESNPPAVQLNAAKAILASLGPMAELGELRARIDALESAKQKPKLGIAN